MRGTISAIFVNAVGLPINFAVQILIARLLGVSQFGNYTYVLSWVNIIVLFSTLGMDSASRRYVAAYAAHGDWGALRGFMMQTSKLSALSGLFAGLMMTIMVLEISPLMSSALSKTFFMAAVLIPVWSLSNLRVSTLRGLKQIAAARAPEFILRPMLLAGLLWIAASLMPDNVDAPIAMFCHILASLLAFGLLSLYVHKALPKSFFDTHPKFHTQEWLRVALSLMLVSGFYVVLNQVDAVMIGLLSSVEEVGKYSAALKIAGLVLFGFNAVQLIAGPLLSEYYVSRSKDDLQKIASQISLLCGVLAVPAILVVIPLGRFILGWFGVEFESAYFCLVILAVAQVVEILIGPASPLLIMSGKERVVLRVLTISFCIN
ncbi:MAG: oligosaccharide flippase family protein, partial [Bdellovibrionales bacterium]|nr:oligosaccharide flippase family protein [Bdellovibrionales bacterium]